MQYMLSNALILLPKWTESCQRMRAEISLIHSASAVHHLNKMHKLTVSLLNIHCSCQRVWCSVHSRYLLWSIAESFTHHDKAMKCGMIFERFHWLVAADETKHIFFCCHTAYNTKSHLLPHYFAFSLHQASLDHPHSTSLLPASLPLLLSLSLPLSSNKETVTMRACVLGHGAKLYYWLAWWAALSLFLPHNPRNPSVLAANMTHTSGPQGHLMGGGLLSPLIISVHRQGHAFTYWQTHTFSHTHAHVYIRGNTTDEQKMDSGVGVQAHMDAYT